MEPALTRVYEEVLMKLLMYPPVEEPRFSQVVAAADGASVVNAASEEEAVTLIADADGFFGKLTPPMLAAATRLRWVQSPTASLEHYVFPELVGHPCTLTNMRGLFSDVIADHVWGMIVALARNFWYYFRNQQTGTWAPVGGESERSNFVAGPASASSIDLAHRHLGDCTLGVVGLGEIGREIAARGAAFHMRTLGVDPQAKNLPENIEQCWPPEQLDQLLEQSDFVVVAAPHTPETQGWFDEAKFAQMKAGSFFINIGRGAIVRLDDLTAALQSGHLAGAALDVFEIEPLPSDHPLWRQENVILTPHVAAASPRISERHLEVLLDNVGRFVRGEELRNVTRKAMWY